MKLIILFLNLAILIVFASKIQAQSIAKPIGCYIGTNGTNPTAMAHPSARGVLLLERWKNIEPTPGVFDFTTLNASISQVTTNGLKYSLAVGGGAFGSPDWLIDSLGADYLAFQYQGNANRLPLWWDSIVTSRLHILIDTLASHYGLDSSLSHVYITQMTVNGVEGHLNGVSMSAFQAKGYTDQKWINVAKETTYQFAMGFPDKPLVFEIHEINGDTTVPAIIINDLYHDSSLCNRVGLGMWWISGKDTYQSDLITFINNFSGDKYAQVIGRSDQLYRFKDSLYATVFLQAKNLGIRYIEPWPYEYINHTYDSLLLDFNQWADLNFSAIETCMLLTKVNALETITSVKVFPNPTKQGVFIEVEDGERFIKQVKLISIDGRVLEEVLVKDKYYNLSRSNRSGGIYVLLIELDNHEIIREKILFQ